MSGNRGEEADAAALARLQAEQAGKRHVQGHGLEAARIRMLADNLLVKPLRDQVNPGGVIIIPDVAQVKRSDRGMVVRLGPGPILDEMGIRVGDVVVVEDFVGSGTPIIVDGEEHLMFGADEVQAVLS